MKREEKNTRNVFIIVSMGSMSIRVDNVKYTLVSVLPLFTHYTTQNVNDTNAEKMFSLLVIESFDS